MPKISSAGVPSYADHEGVVTNAVGEQFEVNASRDLDGERPDDYRVEPVGEPADKDDREIVTGDITPVREDEDKDGKRDDAQPVDEPKRDEDKTPAGSPKKATPPSAAKQGAGVDGGRK